MDRAGLGTESREDKIQDLLECGVAVSALQSGVHLINQSFHGDQLTTKDSGTKREMMKVNGWAGRHWWSGGRAGCSGGPAGKNASRYRHGLHWLSPKFGLSRPAFPGTLCGLMQQVNLGMIGG